MKLAGSDASRYFARPDPKCTGLLIYGADAMRVALRRQQVIAALIGPQGEAEMRLSRIPAADLRKDGVALGDASRAQGFFPGPRVAFLEDAGDALAPQIAAALKDWRPGDATLIVTAGNLRAKSALRKLFEDHGSAVAIGLYDDPPSRDEINVTLGAADLTRIEPAALTDLVALAGALDPGDFHQTVAKIALYKWGDPTPLTPIEVAACAPATIEAEVDDLAHAVAERRFSAVGPLIRRLEGQGVQPVALCIGALRHFRILHTASSDPAGAASGLARLRPPVNGPRRDRLLAQARVWPLKDLETALGLLVETDLALRSSSRAPAMAVMERTLLRLAMMRR